MGVSFIGLIVVGILVLIVGGLVVGLLIGWGKSLGKFRLGHEKLNCPHCNAETPATLEACQACGKPLR